MLSAFLYSSFSELHWNDRPADQQPFPLVCLNRFVLLKARCDFIEMPPSKKDPYKQFLEQRKETAYQEYHKLVEDHRKGLLLMTLRFFFSLSKAWRRVLVDLGMRITDSTFRCGDHTSANSSGRE